MDERLSRNIITVVGIVTACLLLAAALINSPLLSITKVGALEIQDITLPNNSLDVVVKNPTDTDILITKVKIEGLKYIPTVSILKSTASYNLCTDDNNPKSINVREGKILEIPVLQVVEAKKFDRFNITFCQNNCDRTYVVNEFTDKFKITLEYDKNKEVSQIITLNCP